MNGKWLGLCCLAAAVTIGGAPLSPVPDGMAHAQSRGDRAAGRVDRRERVVDRLRHLQKLEALQRAERATARLWVENRKGRAIAERRNTALRSVIRNRLGEWVERRHILALALDEETLKRLRPLGFSLVRRKKLESLGLEIAVLRTPDGRLPDEALEMARQAVPEGRFTANHLFDPSGVTAKDIPENFVNQPLPWTDLPPVEGLKIGQIDLGIDSGHPALRNARIIARTFTGEDGPAPSAHGTAVASLLVGGYRTFTGASVGAELLAADVFGDADEGGSVEAILAALEWMASEQVPVIAMPLVGPPNALLEIALERLSARGALIVAPVGNDGPTEPVSWPAAYDSVIAVTATDRDGHVFLTAQRGPEVMLAAVGVALPAAADPHGMIAVEGTSFAVPEVAARLLRLHGAPDRQTARGALDDLIRAARDLGAPGRDPVYGEGWVSYAARPGDHNPEKE